MLTMSRHSLLLAVLLLASPAGAASNLYPVRAGTRCGFMDRSGKLVLEARYESAGVFGGGLASVWLKGKGAYIDASGRLVIPCTFDVAGDFHEGRAVVRIGERYAYIDRNGKVVNKRYFDRAWDFSGGLGMVKVGKYLGYCDRESNIVIRPTLSEAGRFMPNGLAWAVCEKGCGYLDRAGRWAIEPRFRSVAHFSEGIACVREKGKIVYIDMTARVVLRPRCDDGGGFVDGLSPARTGGKWGFMDRTGKYRITPAFDQVGWFGEGRAIVWVHGLAGFIDETGKYVVPPRYTYVEDYHDGIALVRYGPLEGYIDRDGRYVWNPAAHALVSAFRPLILWMVVMLFSGIAVRWYASRAAAGLARARRMDQVGRLYRLHRVVGAVASVYVVGFVSLLNGPFRPLLDLAMMGTIPLIRWGVAFPTASYVVLFPAVLGTCYAGYIFIQSAAFPVDRIVRGTTWTVWGYMGMHLRFILVALVPITLWRALNILVPNSGFAVLVLFLVAVFSFAPLWMRLVWWTKPVGDKTISGMISALSRRVGVRVSSVHLWSMPGGKVANAMIVGLFPFCRTVFLSDALVQYMTLGEIRAIVAHEFGHIKNNHLWGNLGFALVFGLIAGAVVIFANLVPVIRDAPPILRTLCSVVGLIFGYILLFGLVSREYEFAADRFAADVAGWKTCAFALGKLAQLNATPARWTRWHGRLMTHPSMEERIRAVAVLGFSKRNRRRVPVRVKANPVRKRGRF